MSDLQLGESDFVLNWAIVGSGRICNDFCTALNLLKRHRLVGVADHFTESGLNFSAKFHCDYYDSYDALLASPQVNIAYIGLVNSMQKELCLKAIYAGKHVLCEKPCTLNSIELEEVLQAASDNNVFFLQGIWTRFFPITRRLKQEVKNKSIGELKFLSANHMIFNKYLERIKSKELGGGVILDLGVYPIQLACLLFDHEMPTEIKCTGHLMSPNGVDESCTIVLLYSNERMAQLNVSVGCGPYSSVAAVGEKGVIQIRENMTAPTELILANGERVRVPLPACGRTNFANSAGLCYEAEEVRLAIGNGLLEHPLMTHDNSRLIMRIMDEARGQLFNNI